MRFSVALLLLTGMVFALPSVNINRDTYGAEGEWGKIKGRIGNKSGIEENLHKPLKSDTPMRDMSGDNPFSAKVSCPSADAGVVIDFVPDGGGNDYRLIVKEDLDLDGSYEYIYDTGSAGVRVSGVCYSGVISCDAGTWNNCEYYYWDVTPGGYVSLQRTNDTSILGACFCSNASCGVNQLVQEIVDYVGGGVSAAIMRARPQLEVSKNEFDINSFQLKLYVQQGEGCSYQGQAWGEADIEALSSHYPSNPPDGMSYVASNPSVQSDPNSPYYLVNQASQVSVEGQKIGYPSRVSCDVRNDVAVATVDDYESCATTWTDKNGEVWCEEYFESLHQDIWADLFSCLWVNSSAFTDFKNCVLNNGFGVCGATYTSISTVDDEYVDCNIGVGESRHGIDHVKGSVTLKRYQKYAVRLRPRNTWDSYECKFFLFWNTTTGEELIYRTKCDKSWDRVEIIYTSPFIKDGGTFTIEGEYAVDDWGDGWSGYDFYIYKSQVYKRDAVSLSQINTCPTDPRCVVRNEWVCDNTGNNCIQTVRDGVKTGITPQPYCYQTTTQIGNYIVCAYGDRIEVSGNPPDYNQTYTGQEMWFWIKREYECPSEGIDIDLSRAEGVISSTNYNSGDINYQDQGQSYSVSVGDAPSCPVAVCTVQTAGKDTSVFADRTNRGQTPGGTTVSPLEVRSCEMQNGSWVCPVGQGETLVEDCRCDQGLDSRGFTTSITTLQAVVDASKDIICSTVAP